MTDGRPTTICPEILTGRSRSLIPGVGLAIRKEQQWIKVHLFFTGSVSPIVELFVYHAHHDPLQRHVEGGVPVEDTLIALCDNAT